MSLDGAPENESLVESLPGLARLAAGMWWRTATWSVAVSIRTSGQLARAAADTAASMAVVRELTGGLREYARDLLGVTELEERVRRLIPPEVELSDDRAIPVEVGLKARGAQLLRQSASVDADDHVHPAYTRILTELAPDEARILRLLATEGAQPAVDVRATNLLGVSSELITGGMNMIGAQAGLRHRDHVPAYLNNLERLGLIWFSREPVSDPIAYQVLEAQPEVLEALGQGSRGKTMQRSIHLTPFGTEFCDAVLPLESDRPTSPAGGGASRASA